jgi:hypothetical protein
MVEAAGVESDSAASHYFAIVRFSPVKIGDCSLRVILGKVGFAKQCQRKLSLNPGEEWLILSCAAHRKRDLEERLSYSGDKERPK